MSFRFCAGRSTVLTPARSAPISFSLMPPTAVTRPRSEISPWHESEHGSVLKRSFPRRQQWDGVTRSRQNGGKNDEKGKLDTGRWIGPH